MKTRSTKSRSKEVPIEQDLAGSPSENRWDCIATTAYFKAEARGFVPGYEVSDWLQAEMEFERNA